MIGRFAPWPFEWQSKHVTPRLGNSERRSSRLIELLLWERSDEQAQAFVRTAWRRSPRTVR
jgi:hypothetical protein